MHWLLSSSRFLDVVLMTQAHAVLHTPEQHGIATVWDHMVDFSCGCDYTLTLAHMAQRIPA